MSRSRWKRGVRRCATMRAPTSVPPPGRVKSESAPPMAVPAARQTPMLPVGVSRTQVEPVLQRLTPMSVQAIPSATRRTQRPVFSAVGIICVQEKPVSHAVPVTRQGPPSPPGAKQTPRSRSSVRVR